MDDQLHHIADQDTVNGVIGATASALKSLGIVAGSIHITAPHASQVAKSVFIEHFGHAPDWVAQYSQPEFRRHDPFPDHAMRSGETLTYARALRQLSLKPEQLAFIEVLRTRGLLGCLAIPVYGPFDFDTFFSVVPGDETIGDDERRLQELVLVAELSNRRLAQLAETSTARDLALSDRETEVLNWIGRSKSIRDIATILDVTPATIDTYVRRLYAKLGTNDRIAAVLKGIRLGLIRF